MTRESNLGMTLRTKTLSQETTTWKVMGHMGRMPMLHLTASRFGLFPLGESRKRVERLGRPTAPALSKTQTIRHAASTERK